MRLLYISTGCDYISYFKTFGEVTIINNFMQCATFISSGNAVGSLLHTNPNNKDIGSFVYLIGTCYFKKHITAFISHYGHMTPLQLYNSVDNSLTPSERHEIWLHKIRQAVCNRIVSEKDCVPTCTSLWQHWFGAS